MSSKKDSSTLYPSVQGSNVHRGSGFWSMPTIIWSPACSSQSIANNVTNKPDKLNYKTLVEYPAQTLQYKMLNEFTE